MIRTVRIHIPLNTIKLQKIHNVLAIYNNCVNYYIAKLWSEHRFYGQYLEPRYMKLATQKFGLTSRLTQCAGRQALGIVKSQESNPKKVMPRLRVLCVNLDSRFWRITRKTNTFEWIKLKSDFTSYIPFNKTRMWNKWTDKGFTLSKSSRLSIIKGKLYMDFIFEKDSAPLKTNGATEGIDLGYVNLAVCSDGQVVGSKLNEFVRKFHKREKHTYIQMTHKVFHEMKKLDLENISKLVIENLKEVTQGKRGMFSRQHNRRLSHWLYAKVIKWLGMRCEEQGIQIEFVSPYKTSQYCRICGKWDRRSRNGDKFKCIFCGHKEQSDANAAQNLKLLGLAGVYSLRSLQTSDTCLSMR